MPSALVVPGLNGSGPDHWQTWMETKIAGSSRVIQQDWRDPDLEEWSFRVRLAIARSVGKVVLVAHSFGALAAIEALSWPAPNVVGAMLVAPASPSRFGPRNVAPATRDLPIPSLIVASRNDPWMSLAEASAWAEIWGSELIDMGNAGHINTASGFGPWPYGLELWDRLLRRAASGLPPSRRPDIFEQLGDII
jgi:predicted alpha/beta hydrolase family esterase